MVEKSIPSTNGEEIHDPLATFRGKPLIDDTSSQRIYLGRMIVEAWDDPHFPNEVNLACSCSSVPGSDPKVFLKKVAESLNDQVEFVPEKTLEDLLATFHGKPFISETDHRQTYLGRMIVEIWDDLEMSDKNYSIVLVDEAAGLDPQMLLRRIIDGFPAMLAIHPLMHSS